MVSDREVKMRVLVILHSMAGYCLIISKTTLAHACSHMTTLIAVITKRQMEAEHGCGRCRSLGSSDRASEKDSWRHAGGAWTLLMQSSDVQYTAKATSPATTQRPTLHLRRQMLSRLL